MPKDKDRTGRNSETDRTQRQQRQQRQQRMWSPSHKTGRGGGNRK